MVPWYPGEARGSDTSRRCSARRHLRRRRPRSRQRSRCCLPGQIPPIRRKHPQQRVDSRGAIDHDQTRTAIVISADESAAQLGERLRGGRGDAGVIGSLAVDDLFRETELEMATDPVDKLGAVATVKHELDRAADRRWITPDLMAQVIE